MIVVVWIFQVTTKAGETTTTIKDMVDTVVTTTVKEVMATMTTVITTAKDMVVDGATKAVITGIKGDMDMEAMTRTSRVSCRVFAI